MRSTIVGGWVIASCFGLAGTDRTLEVKLLEPGESEEHRKSGIPIETGSDEAAEATANLVPPPKIEFILGMRRRGIDASLWDVLALGRFIKNFPQPVYGDSRFDRKFGPQRSAEFEDTSKLMHFVDRTLGEFDAYLVRASTLWIARASVSDSARDAAFLAVEDLELVSAARPTVLVVAAKGDAYALLSRFLESAASARVRIAIVGPARLISVAGPAGELGFVATAIADGLATSASSSHRSPETLLEWPDSANRRLVLQFDEVEGSTLNDFVAACREQNFVIEQVSESMATRRIRICVRIHIRPENLGVLVEDVARALDLVVTGDGNRRRLWEPDQFTEARDLAATGVPAEGRDAFAVAVELAAIGSWRHRATWIEVEVPMNSLTPERAIALLQPVFVDSSRDGDAVVRGNAICLRGPAHVVVRNAEIVTAAEKLLTR